MNLPNKITMTRIIVSFIVLIILMFPYSFCGISVPNITIGGRISMSIEYLIAGGLFVLASLTDFLDGKIARKRGIVTEFGKVMDAIADKVLVNGILIVLACNNMINPIIPVVIIIRDIFVDSIKMVAGKSGKAVGASKMGKVKTTCMMLGITLVFFYNLPFEFFGVDVAAGLLYIATVLSVLSGVQYYLVNKEYFADK